MELHHIHGTEVNFHTDANESIDFLKNGIHNETAQKYFNRAQEHGEAHFIDDHGIKYTIKHEKIDGQPNFSVKKSYNN
jgi:hypothetical protein